MNSSSEFGVKIALAELVQTLRRTPETPVISALDEALAKIEAVMVRERIIRAWEILRAYKVMYAADEVTGRYSLDFVLLALHAVLISDDTVVMTKEQRDDAISVLVTYLLDKTQDATQAEDDAVEHLVTTFCSELRPS